LAFVMRWVDELLVNLGFDAGCGTTAWTGRWVGRLQNGRAQRYLAMLGAGVVVLGVWMLLGGGAS
jgi:hypothetical protein